MTITTHVVFHKKLSIVKMGTWTSCIRPIQEGQLYGLSWLATLGKWITFIKKFLGDLAPLDNDTSVLKHEAFDDSIALP